MNQPNDLSMQGILSKRMFYVKIIHIEIWYLGNHHIAGLFLNSVVIGNRFLYMEIAHFKNHYQSRVIFEKGIMCSRFYAAAIQRQSAVTAKVNSSNCLFEKKAVTSVCHTYIIHITAYLYTDF